MRVIKRQTQHLSVQVTRSLKIASLLVSVANQRAGKKPNCGDNPYKEVATGDPVRTATEKYCKSRRIRTESREVIETTIHDQQELWRLSLQLVIGTLRKV